MTRSPIYKYFDFISLILMATTFLPIVFTNLPPVIRSHHLWALIWGLSLFFFYPKIFFDKTMLYIIIYGIIFYIATLSILRNMDEWNKTNLILEFYNIIIGASIITYYLKKGDYLGLAILTRWAIAFLCITAIMSIVTSVINPMYARDIVGVDPNSIESAEILRYKRYGGGNYSTALAFLSLIPILIYYYKNISNSLITRKQITFISLIFFSALISMQLFANILLVILFGILAFLGTKRITQSTIIISLFLTFTIFIPRDVYINSLNSLSNNFEQSSDLNYKLRDLALFIQSGEEIKDSNTGTGNRAERYPLLWETFQKKPLLGCYFYSGVSGNGYHGEGAHLYWMNKLTITGILGLFLFLIIPYSFIRKNLHRFKAEYRFYYLLASLSILSYGLLKGVSGRETWYAFFIIIPGLYYLPLLKKKKNIRVRKVHQFGINNNEMSSINAK